MKRIFIAVKVEPGEILLKMISLLKSALANDSIKWTSHDNIHITLAFIGDTEEEKIKAISGLLKERCERLEKFDLVIKGSGVFKNYSDPRVLWIGIEPSGALMQLNNSIVSGLRDAGISLENRPFKPHLTLGRIKKLTKAPILKELIDKYKEIEFQKVTVNEIILYESILLHSGPVYKTLFKFNLSWSD